MSATTVPNLAELVAQAKQSAEEAKALLLTNFSFVPDDKLTWSPSASARSAVQIVAHCGAANEAFAEVIAGGEIPINGLSPEEASAQIRISGATVTSREEAVELVEESTARVIAALDKATPELLATAPMTPFGPFPYEAWMVLPGQHMGGHAQQLAYLQTIWGDLEDHM
jgi:hypothetical protein